MSDGLVRLVYVSTSASAIDQQALQSILDKSAAANACRGITGVLCAGRSHYVQVLEGAAGPVMSLYLRIAADTRHRDPRLLSLSLVAERLFAKWSMAYIDGSAHAAFAQEVLLAERDIQMRTDRAAAILRRFVSELKGTGVPTSAVASGH